jgi:SAM-dependent methyltransferase
MARAVPLPVVPAVRRSMRWPAPPPGRPEWAWLLRLPPRGWILRRLLRPAVAHLPSHAIVVSVGGGPGYEFRELDRLRRDRVPWRYLLLDAQLAMVVLAQRRAAARPSHAFPRLAVADAVALPLRDGSVDCVLSLGVLCCMTEDSVDDAVHEAHRVLRPGGQVVLAVPRWRGRQDEERHTRFGFVRVAGRRPGRAVFRKPL